MSHFETSVSPWKDPLTWLRSEAQDLDNIVSKLKELTNIEENMLDSQDKANEYYEAIFPVDGMMVYTVRGSDYTVLYGGA